MILAEVAAPAVQSVTAGSTIIAGTIGGVIGAVISVFTMGMWVGSWRKEHDLRLKSAEERAADIAAKIAVEDKFANILEMLGKLIEVRLGGMEEMHKDQQRRLDDGDKRFDLLTALNAQVKALQEGNTTIIKMLGKMPTLRECNLRHGVKAGGQDDE